MQINPKFRGLTWEATYEIVLRLIERYGEVNLDQVGTEQLRQWVAALPDFIDDPMLADEAVLNEILREWYEEVQTWQN